MSYPVWLASLGLLFTALERIWPRRRQQPLLRRGLFTDIAYVVFNSHYLGILLAYATVWIAPVPIKGQWLGQASWAVQFVVALVAMDFLQWAIHNLLHRVSWLWEFHKVHHSIVEMDWIGNWRFHWGEILVYRTLLYIPAALLGARGDVLFWVGVLNTAIGHFAHANLRWHIGWLKYLVNSPEMHIWHHNHPSAGPVNKNFAITLAVWDWLFGTAHVPADDPARLGFEGIEKYPEQLPGQWLAPFQGMPRQARR